MADDTRRAAKMREDRPLDALFPELTHAPEARALEVPAELSVPSVHGRLLHVDLEAGREWGLAVWHTTKETPTLLRATLEAALLRELSMPPGAPGTLRLAGIHIACFSAVEPAILRSLGFVTEQWDAEAWRDRMRAWRQEAGALGLILPDAPLSVWRMEVGESPLGEAVQEAERSLERALAGQRWGDQPGQPSHQLVSALRPHLPVAIRPTTAGLDVLDAALVSREPHVLRWLPPLVFQGLCDLVAVTWGAALAAQVQWALGELTPDGSALPPQIKVTTSADTREIQLGLVLLRLCVLPIPKAEAAPPLGGWLRALNAPRAND